MIEDYIYIYIIKVQFGLYLGEDDITQYEAIYGRN